MSTVIEGEGVGKCHWRKWSLLKQGRRIVMNLEQFLRGKYLGDKSLAGTRECFPGNVNSSSKGCETAWPVQRTASKQGMARTKEP